MKTTLDEWEILHTVVQLGGFAPAAKQLNRSQSTISYAIARLQEQLGIKLFELKGRKAHLTEVGRALLADAEPHLAGFHQLEQRARSLARPWRGIGDSTFGGQHLPQRSALSSSRRIHAAVSLCSPETPAKHFPVSGF